ncbi:DNA circularization protein [Endozoicomonas sp. ALE010]|uniref:DNA circularization protein n=1 Tax=Endozoicomonas sp. ALE010 TaxID=3403081 RepID=UPI003BB4FDBD
MTWREHYQQASFRGVPFHTRTHDASGGRNTDSQDSVDQEDANTEDTGRKTRRYSVEAYVVGLDYQWMRDALLAALDQAGPGELVHPYLGVLQVICDSWQLRESADEGGMARFSLTFTEKGDTVLPRAWTDRASTISQLADQAEAASIEAYADTFSIEEKPDFVARDALEQLASVTDQINQVSARLGGAGSYSSPVISQLNNSVNAATGLMINVRSLTTLGNPLEGLAALGSLLNYDSGASSVNPITASRQQQQTNRLATEALTREAALITSARLAVDARFDSVNQAEATRDTLLDALDDIAGNTLSDNLFDQLQALRQGLYQTLPDQTLPSVGEYTASATQPALVTAYELYRDPDRGEDIARRNGVAHPGFLPGGQPLEVLTHG